MKQSIALRSCKYVTREIKTVDNESKVTDRQERVKGFKQSVFSQATAVLVGAGGINCVGGQGYVRKGIGTLKIFDHDIVEPSNLNRQKFYQEDLYKNKAICLAKNLAKEAVKKTSIIGYPFSFQKAAESNFDISCDVAICGVDNNRTRVYASRYFYERGIPLIVIGLSRDANNGYVFVQKPGKACFGCAFPEAINDTYEPCPGIPAVIDIATVVSGLSLYAVDSVIMERKRNWNYRSVYLAGFVPDVKKYVERKKDCPLCK